MADIKTLLNQMYSNPQNVRFADLRKVCDHYFGDARIRGGHFFYVMPWQGKPLVNIQADGNKAKGYQVKQCLQAIAKLKEIKSGE